MVVYVKRLIVLFSEQIRGARSILGWGQLELAQFSNVGVATIRRIEAENGPIRGNIETLRKIQAALEKAGVEFIYDDGHKGPGVRLARTQKAT